LAAVVQIRLRQRTFESFAEVTGIILAAGASQRMGTPKALLDFHGETFVARLVRVMSLGCDAVTVVLGYQIDDVRPHVPNRARVAINPNPARGQLSSLQTALAELAPTSDVAFIPVDCPAVAEDTVVQLSELFGQRDDATQFVIPRMGQKRGHPVFATASIAREMLALAPTEEARSVVHRYVPQTQYLDVADYGIFADIDTPEAYQRLLLETQR
jgi:CTP:molybdopterin cytidylyltransferase MocA